MKKRVEKDSLGEVEIDDVRLWGAHTQRALANFQVSGFTLPFEFIKSIILIKLCYAKANAIHGLLDSDKAEFIISACQELLKDANYESEFPLDVFQTGSGTSTNMNCNEVIANLALKKSGRMLGQKSYIHPNDHVNLGQSSNDVIPAAIHITALELYCSNLKQELELLNQSLVRKSKEFWEVIKLGRTHLQDAVPIRVGQEILGWADQIKMCFEALEFNSQHLKELPLGGTAVGTGVNTNKNVVTAAVAEIAKLKGIDFHLCRNNFSFQSSQDAIVGFSGALNRLSVACYKISNDIRHLSSGPRGGIGEYIIPSLQAGSSVMPGKVNPVILESAMMASCFAMSLHSAISLGGISGNFQLNTSLPLIAFCVVHSIKILSSVLRNLRQKVIDDLNIDVNRCKELVLKSPSLCTPLSMVIGYDRAADVYKFALTNNLTIPEAIERMGLIGKEISENDVKRLLDIHNLV